jgi:hypothetical protein
MLVRCVLSAALACAAPAAVAHVHLEKSQPAADGKSAEVREIRLVFSEAVESKLSTVQLQDREDRAVVEPAAERDPSDPKVLTVHLFEALPPGSYKVVWSVVAGDGHRMRGNYSFLVSR